MVSDKLNSRKNENIKEGIVKNSFWNLCTSLIMKFGGLIFTILIARLLLPEGYGIYSIIFSIVMVFLTLSDLGINYAAIRYLSYAIEHDRKKVKSYYNYLLRLKILLTVTSSIALLILAYPLSNYTIN